MQRSSESVAALAGALAKAPSRAPTRQTAGPRSKT
jgi:hypothetical protein